MSLVSSEALHGEHDCAQLGWRQWSEMLTAGMLLSLHPRSLSCLKQQAFCLATRAGPITPDLTSFLLSIILRPLLSEGVWSWGRCPRLWDPAIPTVCALPISLPAWFSFSVSCHGCPLCPPVTVSSLALGWGPWGLGSI